MFQTTNQIISDDVMEKWKDFHVFTQIYIFLAVPVQELFQDIYFPMGRPMPW